MEGSPPPPNQPNENNIDSIVLEEEIDPNYVPSENEVIEYAKWLGMDLEHDQDLFWIAREGLMAPLPNNWKPCKTKDTEDIYYFNFATGESTWDHPCDGYYKRLYEEEKKKKETQMKANNDSKRHQAKQDLQEILGKKEKKPKKTTTKPEPLTPATTTNKKLELNPVLERKPLPTLSKKAEMKVDSINERQQSGDLPSDPEDIIPPLGVNKLSQQPLGRPLSAGSNSNNNNNINSSGDAKAIVSNRGFEGPKNDSTSSSVSISESKEYLTPRSSFAFTAEDKGNSDPNNNDKRNQRNFLSHKGLDTASMSLPQSPVPVKHQSQQQQQQSSTNSSIASLNNNSSSPYQTQDNHALADAQATITRLQQENQTLQYKISFHELELKKSKSELDSYYSAMERSKGLEEEVLAYKRQLLAKDEELLQAKIDFRNLENDKNRINKKLEELSLDAHKDRIALKNEYEQTINTFETENKRYQQSIQQKESDINLLRNKNMELMKQVDSLQSQLQNSSSSPVASSTPHTPTPTPTYSHSTSSNNLLEMKYKAQLEQLEKEKRDIQFEFESKTKGMDSLQLQLQSMEKENLHLTNSIITKQNEIKGLHDQIHQLNTTIQQTQQQLQQSRNEAIANKAMAFNSSSSSSSRNNNNNSNINIPSEETLQLKTKLTQQESELQIKQQNIQLLQEELVKTQETLRQKEIEVIGQRSKIFNLEQTIQNQQQLKNHLEMETKRNLQLQEDLSQLTVKYNESQQQSLILEEKTNQTSKDLKSAQSDYSQLQTRYDAVQRDATQLRKEIELKVKSTKEQYEANLQKKEKEIDRLQSFLHNLELENQALKDSASSPPFNPMVKLNNVSSQTDMDPSKAEMEQIKLDNQSKQQMIEGLKGELVTQQQRIQQIINERDELNEQYHRLIVSSQKQVEEIQMKDKRLSGFTEELLQVQKRLDDAQQKRQEMMISPVGAQTDLHANEIEQWRRLCQEKDAAVGAATLQLQSKESDYLKVKNELEKQLKTIELLELKIQSLDRENQQLHQQLILKNQELIDQQKKHLSMSVASSSVQQNVSVTNPLATNHEAKIVKLELDIEQFKLENQSKQKTIEVLKEEILNYQQKLQQITNERDDLHEQCYRLTVSSQKQAEDLQTKEKRLKGFTEELLQVQKRLDDAQQKRHDVKPSFTQTDLHAHEIEQWRKSSQDRDRVPTLQSSSSNGLEEHLHSIKNELDERRRESQLLFQLLQQYSSQGAAASHNTNNNNHHHKEETPIPKVQTETAIQKRDADEDAGGDDSEERDEEIEIHHLNHHHNHPRPHRSAFSPIISDTIERLNPNIFTTRDSSDDELESITDFHVFPTLSWTSHTTVEYFEAFSKNFDQQLKSLLHSDVLFKKQVKSSSSSTSSSASLDLPTNSLANGIGKNPHHHSISIPTLKKSLQTRLRREEKFFISSTRLLETLKSFIGAGRKEIKRLKQLLNSSAVTAASSSSTATATATVASSQASTINHQMKQRQQQKEQDFQQKREIVNQLSNQLNLLIRFARNFQDYIQRRQENYQIIKPQLVSPHANNTNGSKEPTSAKGFIHMIYECLKLFENLGKELIALQDECIEIYQTLQTESAVFTATKDATIQQQQQQQQQQQLQLPHEYHHHRYDATISPNENNQYHNILLRSVDSSLPFKKAQSEVTASYPGPHHLLQPSSQSSTYQQIHHSAGSTTDYLRSSLSATESNHLMKKNSNHHNHHLTNLNYQQKSAILHQELNNVRNQQVSSLQEIDKHKNWLDNLLKEVNVNPWLKTEDTSERGYTSLRTDGGNLKVSSASSLHSTKTKAEDIPKDKFQREIFFV